MVCLFINIPEETTMSHIRKLIDSGNELIDFERIRLWNVSKREKLIFPPLPLFDVDYYLDNYLPTTGRYRRGIRTFDYNLLQIDEARLGDIYFCFIINKSSGEHYNERTYESYTRKQLKQIALDWYF